uniref:Uncharacterized protein n=1 Tax=Glossina austeni TaxID=7395 RepID=A0A1A9VJB1_GLOAU
MNEAVEKTDYRWLRIRHKQCNISDDFGRTKQALMEPAISFAVHLLKPIIMSRIREKRESHKKNSSFLHFVTIIVSNSSLGNQLFLPSIQHQREVHWIWQQCCYEWWCPFHTQAG